MQILYPESGLWTAPNWPKVWKMTTMLQFSDMTSSLFFFWRCFVFVVNFSYWSKIHVNIITGSGIMTIFFYERFARNPDIGSTPVWVLPNIWRLDRVMDTKYGTNVFNRMLLNAAKFRVIAFIVFELLRENQLGGGGNYPPPTQIRVKRT